MIQAAYVNAEGRLEVGQIRRPKVRAWDVLVNIHAASVNPVDWKTQKGLGALAGFTGVKIPKMIVGSDVAGIVEATGARVKRFAAGDRVFGMLPRVGGASAEVVAVPAVFLQAIPESISFEDAAAMPLAALTAWQALTRNAKLKRGERVLVVGASGGVGHYAVQIAKSIGANVTAVCSGKNADFVRALGADQVIDYTTTNVAEAGQTFDVIHDAVGTFDLAGERKIMASGCRFVTTAGNANPSGVLRMAGNPIGKHFGNKVKTSATFCMPIPKDMRALTKLLAEGKLKSTVDSVYPLAEIAKAWERSQSGRARGKIVVKIA